MTGAVPGAGGAGRLAGLLLTGGRSRRMGRDKSQLVLGGRTMAARLGGLLVEVVGPALALEVGPGSSGLAAVREAPPFAGPLAAVVAGWRALAAAGHTGPVLVVACDLPLLDAAALRLLADWPGEGSVVPVADGRRQLLSARWSPADLAAAEAALAGGARALREVQLGDDLVELGPDGGAGWVATGWTADWDTPGDVARLLALVDLEGEVGG